MFLKMEKKIPAMMAMLKPEMAMMCAVPVFLKAFLQFLRHAGIHAEQNTRQQGRFGVLIQTIGIFKQLCF